MTTVVIWRSALLLPSETFIRHQGEALDRWRPVFMGARKVASPIAADTDVIVYPRGWLGFLALRSDRTVGPAAADAGAVAARRGPRPLRRGRLAREPVDRKAWRSPGRHLARV